MRYGWLLAVVLTVGALSTAQAAEGEKAKEPAIKKGYVVSILTVKTSKEEADAFVKAFTDSPKASHKQAGFVGMAVAEDVKEAGSFIVLTIWESQEALNAYIKSEGFRADHAKMADIQSAKPEPARRYVVKED